MHPWNWEMKCTEIVPFNAPKITKFWPSRWIFEKIQAIFFVPDFICENPKKVNICNHPSAHTNIHTSHTIAYFDIIIVKQTEHFIDKKKYGEYFGLLEIKTGTEVAIPVIRNILIARLSHQPSV